MGRVKRHGLLFYVNGRLHKHCELVGVACPARDVVQWDFPLGEPPAAVHHLEPIDREVQRNILRATIINKGRMERLGVSMEIHHGQTGLHSCERQPREQENAVQLVQHRYSTMKCVSGLSEPEGGGTPGFGSI